MDPSSNDHRGLAGNLAAKFIQSPLTPLLIIGSVLLGIGFLIGLVRRDRRELHDLIADTGVVYAWDADTARLRVRSAPTATGTLSGPIH